MIFCCGRLITGSVTICNIVSLLDMQSRRLTNSEARQALDDTRERVAIVARARGALNGSRNPTLEDALRQVCEALHAQAEPRGILIPTRVECEIHRLSSAQITIVALVVNELATNAIKHAFNEGNGGRIEISMGLNNGRDLKVVVDDDGLSFSDTSPTAGTSFGMGLAKRLMATIEGFFIPPPPGQRHSNCVRHARQSGMRDVSLATYITGLIQRDRDADA